MIFVAIGAQVLVWTIFTVITVTLLYRSYKAVTTEQVATVKELRKDFLILVTLFVLLGMPLVVTVALFIANAALQNQTAFILFIIGSVIILLQGPALFVLQGVRVRKVRQLWYQWLCRCCQKGQGVASTS